MTDGAEVYDEWIQRARRHAALEPMSKVGAVISGGEFVVSRVALTTSLDIGFIAIDVPKEGNCLYHASWQAARQCGILRPFNFSAVQHVFQLRVKVAQRVVELVKAGVISSGGLGDVIETANLIAEPNQWGQSSGIVPTMAMSHLLRRTVVIVSSSGVVAICPADFEAVHGVEDVEDPVVIYHCNAEDPEVPVDRARCNHYARTRMDRANTAKLKAHIAVYRGERHRLGNLTWGVQGDDGEGDSIDRGEARNAVVRDSEGESIDRGEARNDVGCTGRVLKKRRRMENGAVGGDTCTVSCGIESTRKRRSVNCEEEVLKSLKRRAMMLKDVSAEELEILARGQNYTTSPRLALLYYHCCSNDPGAFVHNNEKLLGESTPGTVERLMRSLSKPATPEDIARCQDTARERGSTKTTLSTCASCCEIVRSGNTQSVAFEQLPVSLRYTEDEECELQRYPQKIVEDHLQVLELKGVKYHLNPDLVLNADRVDLCGPCSKDPRTNPFSIASGHDYGRPGELPSLSDVASKCIAPVRCFGMELSLNGKHSTGHAICFPSDGPAACSRVLPCTDTDCLPRVTFLGPKDVWLGMKKKFRKLYSIPCDDTYNWLNVLQHTHSSFVELQINVEDSAERREKLDEMEAFIERNVACEGEALSQAHQARMEGDRFGTDVADVSDVIVMAKAATLKPPEACSSTSHSVIETVLNMINGETACENGEVIPVQRDAEPVVEWTCNGKLIACVFPQLFMLGGARLPQGSWGTKFVRHLMSYYDGRFEKSTGLLALLFNQLQRHSAVKRAAKVGVSHGAVLERLGAMVNSNQFRRELEQAKEDPKSASARRLNASLLRVLSLVGGAVPFSPFERAATRPKIAAMRYRYGVPQHWVTLATPEHDDLLLHRVAALREERRWNDKTFKCSLSSCSMKDLPNELRESARARLAVSSTYPALSAHCFESRFRTMIEDVMQSTISADTRLSRHFGMRTAGAYGHVAGHCSIIEAQADGRLHSHSLIYGSSITPHLLTRVACHSKIRSAVRDWIDSVSCAHLSDETHTWMQNLRAEETRQPRAFEIDLPDVRTHFTEFFGAAERRMVSTNIHTHSFTCHKGRRGKYMCRLARPAGTNEAKTNPLVVTRIQRGDLSKGVRPLLSGDSLDVESCEILDKGYDVENGELYSHRLKGPLVWELHRPKADTDVVETNLVLSALTASHTNSAIINGGDGGDAVEQYQQSYMTKDQAALNGAIPMLLNAYNYVATHGSKAEDRDTDNRKGKFLATRAVNGFSGAQEWPHGVMAFALMGFGSFLCSDTFWYIFPWALVKWISSSGGGECDTNDDQSGVHGENSVEAQLNELVAMANNDVEGGGSSSTKGSSGGTRSYRVDDRLVFVSQAESYINRGGHFLDFSPLEFECIVDVKPVKELVTQSTTKAGRPLRPSFPFASTHPLYGHYHGFLRMKMHTPVFGGRPPPVWKDPTDKKKKSQECGVFARYVISTFTPWEKLKPQFQLNEQGLIDLCREWDHSVASLVNRQRYRYIRNLLERGHRSSTFESVLTDWRNREVKLWEKQPGAKPAKGGRNKSTDLEFEGMFSNHCDIFDLVEKISANTKLRRTFQAMQEALLSVLDHSGDEESCTVGAQEFQGALGSHGILRDLYGGQLQMIASRVHVLELFGSSFPYSSRGFKGVSDAPRGLDTIDTTGLAPEQEFVLRHVLQSTDPTGRPMQTQTMLHGGGGTGKSFVVRRICSEIEARGFKVVSTCTTGAGACQLDRGQTFHSAFKIQQKTDTQLSPQAIEKLRATFDDRVVLIVVDEASMLHPRLLALLDSRLQRNYRTTESFGGKSILLVGDFSQLDVVSGYSLCKLMYMAKEDLNEKQSQAMTLFKEFKILFLSRQQRARDCLTQQRLLTTMRSLPADYPAASKWCYATNNNFIPLTQDVVRAITKPLTRFDVLKDQRWIDSSVVLVTNNQDRATMNAAMARLLATRSRVLLFRWRKHLISDFPELEQAEELLYNEQERPVLFGYFFKGAYAQVLDNANGNVALGIANGTFCRYYSIAWDDDEKTQCVLDLAKSAIKEKKPIVDLPFPPDFINVALHDREGKPIPTTSWPSTDRLEVPDDVVVVPIGLVASKSEAYHVTICRRSKLKLYYAQHAVDLAMALTVWKAQGSTFDRVLVLLEPSDLPHWHFEHLYVALSRVRSTDHIRCVPLSFMFNPAALQKLRPNIFTVRWRMDVDRRGYWQSRES